MISAGLAGLRCRRPVALLKRERVALALAGVVVVAAVAIAYSQTGAKPAPADAQRTVRLGGDNLPSTNALVDSIGVVVHFNYVDTAYRNSAVIVRLLRELGVHHIRDAVPAPGSPLAAGLRAAADHGITATLAIGDVAVDPAQSVGDSLRVLHGRIDAFEGPNELDNSASPMWAQTLRSYMPALAAAVRRIAPNVPLIQPSLLYPSNRRFVGKLPGLYNEHPYPLGGPPELALRKARSELPPGAIRDGVVFTETGYHNGLRSTVGQPPVSEQTAADYLPRLLVSDFAAGIRATFIYELADEKPDPGLSDAEQHFGLVSNDLSPKPGFVAIRTLIDALQASPGPGSGGGAAARIRLEAPGDVLHLALIRPDGSRVVALWRGVSVWDPVHRRALSPSVEHAQLMVEGGAKDVTIWRPGQSPSAVARFAAADHLRLELGGGLVLVSFR